MMDAWAILFPGQGSQLVGMGRDFAEISPIAAETFSQADEILGFDLSSICFNGPAERLAATDIQQPAIFVTSVAIERAWSQSLGTDQTAPAAAAGLSLGEYTALFHAGSLTFEDALRLVHRRGRFMQDAVEAVPGSMVSVMGLNEDEITTVCTEAAGDDVLAPSNFNGPGQVVIAGHAAACERARTLIEARGGRAVPLKVAGAFHSPLMAPAAERLREVLADVDIKPPNLRVPANVDTEDHTTAESIRERLYRQVANPVRWQQSITRLAESGIETFIEVGPGRVLTGLMRRIHRRARAVNVSTIKALEESVPA